MARQRDSHSPNKKARNIGKLAPGSSQPQPGFESEAPAEATNLEHPTPPGMRQAVTRAGVFPTDRAPATRHPGQTTDPGTPGAAAGAIRVSTTDGARGAASQRDRLEGRRTGIGHAPEAPSADSDSPRSADTSGEPGPTAAEPVPAMVYNPNFSAADRVGEITDPGGSDRRIDPEPHFPPPGRAGRRRPERVGEIMTANVECCTPDTELYYVARMMDDRDVGTIPVVAGLSHVAHISRPCACAAGVPAVGSPARSSCAGPRVRTTPQLAKELWHGRFSGRPRSAPGPPRHRPAEAQPVAPVA